jgi:hypothetical protein
MHIQITLAQIIIINPSFENDYTFEARSIKWPNFVIKQGNGKFVMEQIMQFASILIAFLFYKNN